MFCGGVGEGGRELLVGTLVHPLCLTLMASFTPLSNHLSPLSFGGLQCKHLDKRRQMVWKRSKRGEVCHTGASVFKQGGGAMTPAISRLQCYTLMTHITSATWVCHTSTGLKACTVHQSADLVKPLGRRKKRLQETQASSVAFCHYFSIR